MNGFKTRKYLVSIFQKKNLIVYEFEIKDLLKVFVHLNIPMATVIVYIY